MSAHDRHLAGFTYAQDELECVRCEAQFIVEVFTEYGQCWMEPEECPACGGDYLEADEDDES